MKRAIIFLVLLLIAVSAFAIDTKGLTPEQIAQIEQTIAASKQANAKGGNVEATLSLASTWGSQAAVAAEGFAKALGIAAREIGVSVNDFMGTPAGKLTAAFIIWKVAGAALVSMMYGTLVVWIGCAVAWMLARHIATKEYASVPYSRLWGLWSGERKVRVYRPFKDYGDGDMFMTFIAVGIVAVSLFVGGALIRP